MLNAEQKHEIRLLINIRISSGYTSIPQFSIDSGISKTTIYEIEGFNRAVSHQVKERWLLTCKARLKLKEVLVLFVPNSLHDLVGKE